MFNASPSDIICGTCISNLLVYCDFMRLISVLNADILLNKNEEKPILTNFLVSGSELTNLISSENLNTQIKLESQEEIAVESIKQEVDFEVIPEFIKTEEIELKTEFDVDESVESETLYNEHQR